MSRMWLRRAAALLVLALLGTGLWAGSNWNHVQARLAAHRLRSAATDDARACYAGDLASRGEEGLDRLIEFLKEGESPVRLAAAGALDRFLNSLPENDPQGVAISGRVMDLFAHADESGREAILSILPTVLNRGAMHSLKSRPLVLAALKMPSVEARLAAVRAAMNPQIGLRAEIVPLLEAPEAEVRRAALFALGPATDAEAVVGDEALFHWLHDADAVVRGMCHDALVSRGRSETEIALGRRLVDPAASERLKLLLDLRFDDDVPDPEPWLERLSRDPDPGVRAGAIRVMMELSVEKRTPPPAWIAKLAEADADPTVRRIAGFYRMLPSNPMDTGIRQIEGP